VINEEAHIRAALSARGIALKQVADACGISKGAVSQWFLSGPGWRPIPERHMATIRELLAEPAPVTAPQRREPQRKRPVKAAGPEPQLVMLQPLAVAAGTLPEPARRRRRAPRAPAPQPMFWGAAPFIGLEPPPRPATHFPGHWAFPPVMPPPAPAYISPAGPRHRHGGRSQSRRSTG
jgi:transcriptional regulator with XRE-family HTH domain